MKLSELRSRSISEFLTDVRAFQPTDRASEAIGFMRENGCWDVMVEDGDRTSIITIRDLLDLTNLDTRLSKLMHQVPRMNLQNSISEAASLMFEYRTGSMPVYEGPKLVGQITSSAIVAKMMESEIPAKLSSIMTRSPATIEPAATVASARELMRRKKIDQIPIVDDGRLVGVITSESVVFNMTPRADRDVKGGRDAGRFEESLGRYGTGSIVTNEITDSLNEVYANMHKEGANYSVVTNTGEVQGILTYHDFMKVLLHRASEPQLPVYIVGLPEDPFEAAAVRQKFTEAVQLLRKGFPEISEARAVIKTGEKRTSKKRCQVDVLILSPKERYSYSVFSYAVVDAFDQVNAWSKRLSSRRKGTRRKPSSRKNAEAPQALG